MINRISIKGRGDDVFFPDEEATNRPVSKEKSEVRASQHADSSATMPASEQASMPASTQAQDIAPADSPVDVPQRRRLRERVVQDHPIHNSYRFTQDELDELRDVAYELEAKRGIKITKNDLVRLGLLWLIDDYRASGKDSLIAEVFKERRE